MGPRPKDQISLLQNRNWCVKENQPSMTLPSEGGSGQENAIGIQAICGSDKALYI